MQLILLLAISAVASDQVEHAAGRDFRCISWRHARELAVLATSARRSRAAPQLVPAAWRRRARHLDARLAVYHARCALLSSALLPRARRECDSRGVHITGQRLCTLFVMGSIELYHGRSTSMQLISRSELLSTATSMYVLAFAACRSILALTFIHRRHARVASFSVPQSAVSCTTRASSGCRSSLPGCSCWRTCCFCRLRCCDCLDRLACQLLRQALLQRPRAWARANSAVCCNRRRQTTSRRLTMACVCRGRPLHTRAALMRRTMLGRGRRLRLNRATRADKLGDRCTSTLRAFPTVVKPQQRHRNRRRSRKRAA